MVITFRTRKRQGWFLVDIAIAIALLLFVIFPLAYSFAYEQKVCRDYYFRVVAGEIVDGELEKIAAGEWKTFPEGESKLSVKLNAATNLPPGSFVLNRRGSQFRLEWRPDQRGKGGKIIREISL